MQENNSYTGLNQLLKILSDSQVDFVVIGGFACVVYGSALVTRDLDVCAMLTPQTILKLREILGPYHPKHRMTPQKLSFLEEPESLSGVSNLYLDTDLGMIDFLSEVKGLGGLKRIKENAETIQVFGRPVHVLSLDDLILAKEQMSRPKDKAAVHELKEVRSRPKNSK